MKNTGLGSLLGVLVAVVAAFGATTAVAADDARDGVLIRGLFYGWAAGVEGDIVFRGVPADVDVRFCDLVDDIELAGMGRVEIWKGRFGATLDGLYLQLEDETDEFVSSRVGATEIEVVAELRQAIFEFGGGVRLFELHPVTELQDLTIGFDALAGGRYWYLKIRTKIDIERTGILGLGDLDIELQDSRSKDWVDPYVGGRVVVTPVENIALTFRCDFGGFGVGSASDHTVNIVTGIEWLFSEHFGLAAGYRFLRLDYARGSGKERISAELDFSGPALGMTFKF